MRLLGQRMPLTSDGENQLAVRLFHRVEQSLDLLRAGPIRRRWHSRSRSIAWPAVAGKYRVGDPSATVAVCTLSSNDLIAPVSALPEVAIAGRLYTLNLGIERMVINITANPRIRTLVLCGKDSPVFNTAQGVQALWTHGVSADRRILGARGHFPVLANVSTDAIDRLRRQVDLVDTTGTIELSVIAEHIRQAALRPRSDVGDATLATSAEALSSSSTIQDQTHSEPNPSGKNAAGFFVITLNRHRDGILCQHFSMHHTLVHEEDARSARRIMRTLLRKELISDLGHAAYLGGELTKAETALRLGLVYEQDQPLRR
jgi:tetrahydromethanopterin S-methyltransferase subunit A